MAKKIICWLVAILFLSICFPLPAAADGGVFGKRYTVFYLKENSQYAVINYVNGKQKMIVSTSFNWKDSDKTAWIFPVPSNPEKTDVDIVDGGPMFMGRDIIDDAKDDLTDALRDHMTLYMLSVIPVVPLMLYVWTAGFMTTTAGGVTVHKSLDKYGLSAEVISSTSGEGIYEYLTDKGLEVSAGIVPQLDGYVDKNYSFVVTWVTNSNVSVRQPGIMLEFPTQKLYYPLILTSIYGDDTIPTEIFVVGHVSPVIYEEIKPYVDITYWQGYISSYSGYSAYNSPEIRNFTNAISNRDNLKFTKIELNAPSSAFKDDLWIENQVPEKVKYANSIRSFFSYSYYRRSSSTTTILIVHLFLSLITGAIIAILVSYRKKEYIPIYVLMSFGNLLGIFWLLLSSFIVGKCAKIEFSKTALFVVLFIPAHIMLIFAFYNLLLVPLL